MKQTINDVLLRLGEAAQEHRLMLAADMALYQQLSKLLPRSFPAPTDFFTRSVVATEYDAAFIYAPLEGEHPEALRLVLSMLFGLSAWEIEIDKETSICNLRAVKQFGNYSVLFRITDVASKIFEYTITYDTGTMLIGPVTCSKFVPLDIKRHDVTPEVFHERLKPASYRDYIHSKQAYICALAAQGFPPQTPLPEDIQPALGMNYDLDISYDSDLKGGKRAKIDKILGYQGWSGVIEKQTGAFSLHTILPLVCGDQVLQVRINIMQAYRLGEQLFLVAETSDRLVYKATRPSDPDYVATVEAFQTNETG